MIQKQAAGENLIDFRMSAYRAVWNTVRGMFGSGDG